MLQSYIDAIDAYQFLDPLPTNPLSVLRSAISRGLVSSTGMTHAATSPSFWSFIG